MTSEKEPKGLSDEEMDKLKKEITDLFNDIDWERLAEDDEDEEEE
jgi:tripartite-type tricarboxylate transporter receptor subunit TctC